MFSGVFCVRVRVFPVYTGALVCTCVPTCTGAVVCMSVPVCTGIIVCTCVPVYAGTLVCSCVSVCTGALECTCVLCILVYLCAYVSWSQRTSLMIKPQVSTFFPPLKVESLFGLELALGFYLLGIPKAPPVFASSALGLQAPATFSSFCCCPSLQVFTSGPLLARRALP